MTPQGLPECGTVNEGLPERGMVNEQLTWFLQQVTDLK